jgi:hypothetical protein
VWLYRLTQGLHVVSGIAAIPLLLVKLWSVWPKLFERPYVGGLVRQLERGSILVLIARLRRPAARAAEVVGAGGGRRAVQRGTGHAGDPGVDKPGMRPDNLTVLDRQLPCWAVDFAGDCLGVRAAVSGRDAVATSS